MKRCMAMWKAFAVVGVLAGTSLVAAFGVAGCDTLYDEVIDPSDPSKGGTVTAAIDSDPPLSLVGIAKGTPLIVAAANNNIVVQMTLGDDAAGNNAKTVLHAADGAITLAISEVSRTQLSVHSGGRGCACTTGIIQVTSDATEHLSGSFSGQGFLDDMSTACQVSGTLTAVPQVL